MSKGESRKLPQKKLGITTAANIPTPIATTPHRAACPPPPPSPRPPLPTPVAATSVSSPTVSVGGPPPPPPPCLSFPPDHRLLPGLEILPGARREIKRAPSLPFPCYLPFSPYLPAAPSLPPLRWPLRSGGRESTTDRRVETQEQRRWVE
jgi:hypothetical protein